MSEETPGAHARSRSQRRVDALEKLSSQVDLWVASADETGSAYLAPLSYYWDDSTLALQNTHVSGNVLSASPGLTVQGAGIFTSGFPLTLTNSIVGHNRPDQCYGC